MRAKEAIARGLVLGAMAVVVLFIGCGKSKKSESSSGSTSEQKSEARYDAESKQRTKGKGAPESRLEVLEIFVGADGRVAFPDELQDKIVRGEIVLPRYGEESFPGACQWPEDEEGNVLRKKLEAFAAKLRDLGQKPEAEGDDDRGDRIDCSAARHIFINADPETRYQYVRKVMSAALDSGFKDFTLGTVHVNGKYLPLVVTCLSRCSDEDDEQEVENAEGKLIMIEMAGDGFRVAGELLTLAEVDVVLKSAPVRPEDVHVAVRCSDNLPHSMLIALLSVCAKHGIPGAFLVN